MATATAMPVVDGSTLRIVAWKDMAILIAPNSKAVVITFTYGGERFTLPLDGDNAARLALGIVEALEALGYSCEPIGEAVH